jgi:hypothetical protein
MVGDSAVAPTTRHTARQAARLCVWLVVRVTVETSHRISAGVVDTETAEGAAGVSDSVTGGGYFAECFVGG